MNYLTSKQASELWGISVRRITQLAEAGRIAGAVRSGRKWLIPASAEKPADARTVQAKAFTGDDRYIFPYIIAVVHSAEQVSSFSADEKALYHANLLHEAGRFESCITELEKLLKTTRNRYIRIGALYLLSSTYMWLSDFDSFEKYSIQFKTALNSCDSHKAELDILQGTFDGEVLSVSDYTQKFTVYDTSEYSDEFLPYLFAGAALADVINITQKNIVPNIQPYEITCAQNERNGYFYSAMMFHYYIYLMYAIRNDLEHAQDHLDKSVAIAVSHDTLFTLIESMTFAPDFGLDPFQTQPEEVRQKVSRLAALHVEARNKFHVHKGTSSILFKLQKNDYDLISRCYKTGSISELASYFGLTESGIKKRLASLYRKFGVKNRKEMLSKYFDMVFHLGEK